MKKDYQKDMELVAACLQNNENAWKIFVRQFRPKCRFIAIRFNSLKDFDDLFSMFILKLLGSSSGKLGVLHKYKPCVSLNTFLSTVFRNMLIDHLRSNSHKELLLHTDAPIDQVFPIETSVPGFGKTVENNEIEGYLRHAVKNLDSYQQQLVDLYYYHELPIREVGRILNRSKSKIARDLHVIHAQLRQNLEDDHVEL